MYHPYEKNNNYRCRNVHSTCSLPKSLLVSFTFYAWKINVAVDSNKFVNSKHMSILPYKHCNINTLILNSFILEKLKSFRSLRCSTVYDVNAIRHCELKWGPWVKGSAVAPLFSTELKEFSLKMYSPLFTL